MITLRSSKPDHLQSFQKERTSTAYLAVFLCCGALSIFLFDLNTPLGVAAGTPYALIVFGTLWIKNKQSTYAAAIASVLLTLAGFFLSPGMVGALDVVLTNRILALLIMLCIAFMVLKVKTVNRELTTTKTEMFIDPLTQCKTNRGFVMELITEIKRCKRYHHNLSLAVFDIDHLAKQRNESEKHSEQLIKNLSAEIGGSVRNSDPLYRIGPNRFAILFVETDIYEAKDVCNALREKIAKANLSESIPNFSLSIGISMLEFSDNRRMLYKRAESALLKAKENGGNQVVTLPEITRSGKALIPAILLRSRTG